MHWFKAYKQRWYVKGIRWSHVIVLVGFIVIPLVWFYILFVGLMLGIFFSVAHISDSRKRIKQAEERLKEMRFKRV